MNYIAMLRFDAPRLGLEGDLSQTGPMAQLLADAGAPVNGKPGDSETPLMTAASYGDADVARVLIDAGADLDVLASPDAGGVPGGSALLHAAVFGMTDVLDTLVRAGARVRNLVEAAAAGDIDGWLTGEEAPWRSRARADHGRRPRTPACHRSVARGRHPDRRDGPAMATSGFATGRRQRSHRQRPSPARPRRRPHPRR